MINQVIKPLNLSPLANLLSIARMLINDSSSDPEDFEKIKRNPLITNASRKELEEAEEELVTAGIIVKAEVS